MSEEPRRRTLTLRCDARLFSEMSALIVAAKVFAYGLDGASDEERAALVEQFAGQVRAYDAGTLLEGDGA